MRKLDWYILKKFIVSFFFCMLLFTVIAVAVDSSEKTDDFVTTKLGTLKIIQSYYFGFIPYIWGLIFPLFVFIAVIFFTSRMATRSEIIAILASGTSYNRMLRPYLIGGVLLGTMLWLGNRYLIPRANEIKSDFEMTYMKGNQLRTDYGITCWNCFYRRLDTNTYVGIKVYDTASRSANAFFMERVKNGEVVYNLRASSIRWDTTVNKWRLMGVTERHIEKMRETVYEKSDTVINISLKPEELKKDDFLKDKLTTPELVAFINREELRGSEGLSTLKVERYRRTATPAAVVLLTLIGAVVASRKSRGGSGLHIALGIIISVLFIIIDRFSTVFATKSNFPPMLAAWVPNILFAIVAFWLYKRTPK